MLSRGLIPLALLGLAGCVVQTPAPVRTTYVTPAPVVTTAPATTTYVDPGPTYLAPPAPTTTTVIRTP